VEHFDVGVTVRAADAGPYRITRARRGGMDGMTLDIYIVRITM